MFSVLIPIQYCTGKPTQCNAMLVLVIQSYPTLCDPMDCSPPGSSVHEDSPGKNTGVGCHALLQGIFPSQGLNPGLPHCQCILYCLRHQGSPKLPEWVAYPFSRESSWPRNGIGVSCMAGEFFYQLSYQGIPTQCNGTRQKGIHIQKEEMRKIFIHTWWM